MLTNDKTITKPEYWDTVYAGTNNGKVDNSNTKRPPNPFDRFGWVAGYAEGPNILGIASGHAHVEKRIIAAHPNWNVIASDQAPEAKNAAKFYPYFQIDAYKIPYSDKSFNMVICTQAMEYMEFQDKFIEEAKRVADKLLITVPLGEMDKWSQLRIYSENNVRELLEQYGTIEVLEKHESLLLVKLKFNK